MKISNASKKISKRKPEGFEVIKKSYLKSEK